MLAGAYSNRFRFLQEQQIHKLKILNAAAGDSELENDIHPGNKIGKSRQLSLETNKRRKVQEMRRKMVAMKEEKRQQEILLQRRQLQQEATERFQRAPLRNKNKTKGTSLEDILCIIRGGTNLVNTVTLTKQRSSSARVFSKDRDKRANSPLHSGNKLLTNRPSSQPGHAVANAHLHDQSLRNLTNSRNLFEQHLRRKLQQQEKTKECEQITVALKEEDTDSEDDLYSVDSVEDTKQDQVVAEENHFIVSTEGNRQKQNQTKYSNYAQDFDFKANCKQISGHSSLAQRENTSSQEQHHPIRQVNNIQQQQQQQNPSQQKNPAIITLASGDNKNSPWVSQENESPSFRKTAWIQPSPALDKEPGGFHQLMEAGVNLNKADTHFDICQINPKELDKDQNCSQQQTNRMLSKDNQPICGAPTRKTIFQPKYDFYEQQLSTTFHPVTNGFSQQHLVWVPEIAQQSKIFTNHLQIEQYPQQISPQVNSDVASCTNSETGHHLKSKDNLVVHEKKKPEIIRTEETKLKCPQGRPIKISQPSDRNCDNELQSDEKSATNNNAVISENLTGDQPVITKQTQQNSKLLTKSKNAVTKKNNAWQESNQKIVTRKLSTGNTKPIRGILKIASVENGSCRGLNITQARDLRDSLEITRQQFNNAGREITEANTQSKPTKKHVHFAAEDQFYELDDVLITDHTELKYEPTSNGAEETVENSSSDNNSNNHDPLQQHNGNGHQKTNSNNKESDNKEPFCNKPSQKPQVNWVQPSGRPQAKAHIIKQTSQVAAADPSPPNSTWIDKKNINEKPLSKNNVQYINMGTLKKLVAPNNQGLPNPKNSYLQKEIETAITKEQAPFTKFGFSVDKTPTDEEINWLWDKVQLCLQQKSTSKPVAQTVNRTKPIVSHMYFDGGILGNKSNILCVGKTSSSLWYPPPCNGGLTLDGKPSANSTKRFSLLHQRQNPSAPRVPMIATPEKVPSFLLESDIPPSSENRFPATSSKEVTSSLAGFFKS